MNTIRTLCQFVAVIRAIAVLTPLLMVYIVGEYIVGWCSLAHELWIQCRKLTALLVMTSFLVMSSYAGQTTLAWDPVVGAGVTNYILVARTNALNNTNALTSPMRISTGTNLQATILNLPASKTYNFGVLAQNASGISDLSNILPIATPPATIQKVVQAQYAVVATNGISAFVDAEGISWRLIIGGQ